MIASQNQSHRLLFSSDPPLPAELSVPPSSLEVREARRAAQIKLVEFLKTENRASPLLLARFIARQVTAELQKMIETTTPGAKKANVVEDDFTDADGTDHGYSIGDHMERLRYLEIAPDKKEVTLLSNVLQLALPGLEGFVLEERFVKLSGKITYNAFGVSYNGGRDDKVRCRVTLPLIRLTFSSFSQSQNAIPKVLRRLGRRMALNARLEVPYTQSPHT
jgi:mitochondrial import receptor subunit TOM20